MNRKLRRVIRFCKGVEHCNTCPILEQCMDIHKYTGSTSPLSDWSKLDIKKAEDLIKNVSIRELDS